ncbi:hypothetical protein F5877DRAFT_66411 [Lentinula edodes]|nr:hypothetical protein F5877DRAFT_66411 [Lentinula edodes]
MPPIRITLTSECGEFGTCLLKKGCRPITKMSIKNVNPISNQTSPQKKLFLVLPTVDQPKIILGYMVPKSASLYDQSSFLHFQEKLIAKITRIRMSSRFSFEPCIGIKWKHRGGWDLERPAYHPKNSKSKTSDELNGIAGTTKLVRDVDGIARCTMTRQSVMHEIRDSNAHRFFRNAPLCGNVLIADTEQLVTFMRKLMAALRDNTYNKRIRDENKMNTGNERTLQRKVREGKGLAKNLKSNVKGRMNQG